MLLLRNLYQRCKSRNNLRPVPLQHLQLKSLLPKQKRQHHLQHRNQNPSLNLNRHLQPPLKSHQRKKLLLNKSTYYI